METARRVEKLRREYERELAASESRRIAYHQAVFGLIEQGGPGLQDLAGELGLLDQTVELHQPLQRQVSASKPHRRRRRGLVRAAGGLATALALVPATFGALRVAQLPPFVPHVGVPHVMNLPEAAAAQRLRAAGLNVRILLLRRELPKGLFHRVLGATQPAGERVAKGSTITIYVAIPRKPAKRPRTHS